jgi:hypothetical protein
VLARLDGHGDLDPVARQLHRLHRTDHEPVVGHVELVAQAGGGGEVGDDVGLFLERVVQHGQVAVGRQRSRGEEEDHHIDLDPRGNDHG